MRTAEDILNKKKSATLITVDADTVIHEAMVLMVSNKVGAMLVTEEEKLKGIWTERDLLGDAVNNA